MIVASYFTDPVMRFHAYLAAVLLAVSLYGGTGAHAQDAIFDPAQTEAIETIVHDYLVEHPEVIKEAIETLKARQEAAQADLQATALSAQRDRLLSDPQSPMAGNPVGDVTIVEFFDYKCPYCKRVTPALIELLEADKGVKLVFKEFPILGQSSLLAARAALAAAKQDRYLDFHNALMAYRGDFDADVIQSIAGQLGLDVEKLKADMTSADVDQQIKDTHDLAQTLSVRSTPTFVIGDQIVPGAMSIDDMKALIAAYRSDS